MTTGHALEVPYDVVIVGGGVSGTAILFALACYTNVERIALVEQYAGVAQVNSSPKNNSQTLHFGDTETNYSLEHALPVREAGVMLANYVNARAERRLHRLTRRMVLAVGDDEVARLRERLRDFSPHYPELRLLERHELAMVEPRLIEGRDPAERVAALVSENGYAINYQLLSQSFLEDALATGKPIHTHFGVAVSRIERGGPGHVVHTSSGALAAPAVVVTAGPYSLLFAQALGYGRELGILPVAGSFYFTDGDVLRNKVYTMQVEQLPFAAVHGDPDVTVADETRFGPTAKVIPMLERHRYRSMTSFFRKPLMTVAGLLTLARIMRNRVIRNFIAKNFFYDWPLIGKHLYLAQIRKIVPSLRRRELRLGKGLGGIRPQIVNTQRRELMMGESKLIGDHIIFNTTPSPGASNSLRNAEHDAELVVDFLAGGYRFEQQRFDEHFKAPLPAPDN
ncbi:MAG: FAD-dependent oxidoreductase [Actinomycetota bacterium]